MTRPNQIDPAGQTYDAGNLDETRFFLNVRFETY